MKVARKPSASEEKELVEARFPWIFENDHPKVTALVDTLYEL